MNEQYLSDKPKKLIITQKRTSRLDAVFLDTALPTHKITNTLKKLENSGVVNPIISGGALRDIFMQAVHNKSVKIKDYDIFANMTETLAPYDGDINKFIANLLENGFELDLSNPKKQAPELLRYDGEEACIIKLIYNDEKIDLVMLSTFDHTPETIAATGDTSICSTAMGSNGQIYVDPYFVQDAQNGIYRVRRADPKTFKERYLKLNRKYNNYFKKVVRSYHQQPQ